MLKKLLKNMEPNLHKSIFPINTAKNAANTILDKVDRDNVISTIGDADKYVYELTNILVTHESFIKMLEELLTNKILAILLKKYNFEPTEQYQKEIADKKQYINQLDEYLAERKKLNCNIENELQQFLHNTTDSIKNALTEFSSGIQRRIEEAESRYGIDAIKHIVLAESNDHD